MHAGAPSCSWKLGNTVAQRLTADPCRSGLARECVSRTTVIAWVIAFAGKPAPARVGVMPEVPVSFITFTLT
ncbi:hypothetical protein DZA28_21695 [Pseudomonas alloputida]|uniref:Uncharacterized protein n=3 Tax=Pseudomonas TaxID=286 RepID=I7BYB9_PSEPT|nr:hypothetical protein T1E_3321 [Pseudomonas putida DOT-T1E]NWL49735.1 hypothetical protein [Pseudomonas hunanensis]PTV63482.1 hypothetical protein DBL03_06735 [Pseudomonas putida]TRZ62411.1 hypothetical protein DZA28_21695 [Pseudomonas alloputida]